MSDAVTRLEAIHARMAQASQKAARQADEVHLVAVSKTFPAEAILPVLDAGQRVFGENRVQEAMAKWTALRVDYPDVDLHLIGHLQSNKAREAVALFDAIHSLDRPSLAKALAAEMTRQNRTPRLFVQVNTGDEPQKGGVSPTHVQSFLDECRALGLRPEGLMCIPPETDNPSLHFALLAELARRNKLSLLSMGMSSDFETAIALGATHIRIGSAIFGERAPHHEDSKA